ncbi:MAG: response regulator [Candidatus Krumholzibacteriota bacterium]|nr:response regulator [Candidatus Krumholzibacteriota bacterium]
MRSGLSDKKGLFFALSLAGYLVAIITISLSFAINRKDSLMSAKMKRVNSEIEFLTEHVRHHLQKYDYTGADAFLSQWARFNREDFSEMRLAGGTGFLISDFKKRENPARTQIVSKRIEYSYDRSATLHLVIDLSSVYSEAAGYYRALGAIVLISTAAIFFIAWLAVKQRSAAVRLRKQAERLNVLSNAIEQSPISILITDRERIIEYVNPRFSEQTGFSNEESIGREASTFLSEKTSPEEFRRLVDTISKGEIWQGEFLNRKKTGEWICEYSTIGPITDKDGEITHFIGFNEDITEEKSLREQLNQSQRLEGIGRLAGGVAHDFNNLLSVIIGHCELAMEDMDERDTGFQDLVQIAHAAGNAADLTRQLLAFSRQQIIEPRTININRLIEKMEKMFTRILGDDISIELGLEGGISPIKADPGQIEQILLNLIMNSQYALNDGAFSGGRKRIIIETARQVFDSDRQSISHEQRPGEYLMISVSDNGVGMDRETRSKIFDPFFTTKKTGEGTGLGLSTVYGIVKQNGGEISAYSEPARGTVIRILWPSLESSEKGGSVSADKIEITGGDERILVVEDDKDVRRVATISLRHYGYEVLEAQDGKTALEIVDSLAGGIDLILTDVVMPVMGGVELVGIMKERFPETAILFCSGYTQRHITGSEIAELNAGFIQKPFRPVDLAIKVREVLDKERSLSTLLDTGQG